MARIRTGNTGDSSVKKSDRSLVRKIVVTSGIVLVVALIVFALMSSCGNVSPFQATLTDSSLSQITADPCEDGQDGKDGETGPAGPQGEPGASGNGGLAGEPGETGLSGSTGATGPAGDQGEPGAPGAEGPIGPEGPAGPVGPVGPVGPAGAPCEGDPVVVTGIVVGSPCSWVHGSGQTLTGTIRWHASGNHGVLHCVQE